METTFSHREPMCHLHSSIKRTRYYLCGLKLFRDKRYHGDLKKKSVFLADTKLKGIRLLHTVSNYWVKVLPQGIVKVHDSQTVSVSACLF